MVVVDDSIVRGTTTPKVVNLLRRAGAKEIHMRVCAPPIKYPCFFGVDMATRKELIAAHKTIPEIQKFIGADSLGYLSLDGLLKSVNTARRFILYRLFQRRLSYPCATGNGQIGAGKYLNPEFFTIGRFISISTSIFAIIYSHKYIKHYGHQH